MTQMLDEFVDHPWILLGALLLTIPVTWRVARAWFRNPVEELAEAAADSAFIALLDFPFMGWPFLKLLWLVIVSAAFVTMFYKFGVWAIAQLAQFT